MEPSSSLPRAILIGVGTFAATGLVLLGGYYIHRQYRNRRDLQLIQQSDALFSSELRSSPPPLLTVRKRYSFSDAAAAQFGAGSVSVELFDQLTQAHSLLEQVDADELIGDRWLVTLSAIYELGRPVIGPLLFYQASKNILLK